MRRQDCRYSELADCYCCGYYYHYLEFGQVMICAVLRLLLQVQACRVLCYQVCSRFCRVSAPGQQRSAGLPDIIRHPFDWGGAGAGNITDWAGQDVQLDTAGRLELQLCCNQGNRVDCSAAQPAVRQNCSITQASLGCLAEISVCYTL